MCGRYVLALSPEELASGFSHLKLNPLAGLAALGALGALDLTPRYNIAPSAQVLVMRLNAQGALTSEMLRWGLLPSWLKDRRDAKSWSNARGETVATNGVFKAAFKRARCIVPAQGFYEWQTLTHSAGTDAAKPKPKTVKLPHYIYPTAEPFFGLAGIAEQWQSPGGEIVRSCCIITTTPNGVMAPIHARMPVIVQRADWADWLNPGNRDLDQLQTFIKPYPDALMAAHPVSSAVSLAGNQGATLIVAITEAQHQQQQLAQPLPLGAPSSAQTELF